MKRPHLISKNGYLHIAVFIHKFGPDKKIILDNKGNPKWFRKTITTGQPDNKQGRSLAGDSLQQYRSGSLPSSNGFSPILLSDFLVKYNDLYPTKNPNSLKVYGYAVNSFTRILGNKYMHLYSVEEIDSYISLSLTNISGITVKNYVKHLTTLFSRAKKYHHILDNVFHQAIEINLPEPVYRTYTGDEFKKLLEIIDVPLYKDICIIYVYTGMRLSELLRQELSEIDDQFIHVTKTKTKKDRYIEIHDHIRPIIEKYRKCNQKYLIEYYPGKPLHKHTIQDKIKGYLCKAGLDPNLTAKAMRKTFGSWLLDEGVPIEWIASQLGNSVAIALKHYAKYQKRVYKGWVNRMK